MPDWLSNIGLARMLLCASSGVTLLFFAEPAHASEEGASTYLLGSGEPYDAILPPVQGILAAPADASVDAVPAGPVEVFPQAMPAQTTEPPESTESALSMEPAQPALSEQPETPAPAPAPALGEIVVTGRRPSPADPLAELNATSYDVTQSVDKAIVAPVAFAYKEIMPRPIRSGLRNFLKNLSEPIVFLNFMLQLKPGKAAETFGRFAINTTLGAAGLIDVAKRQPFNLPYRRNGFANTLGYYGVKPGPYFYLPLVGSTTLRDFIGNRLDLLILPTVLGSRFTRPKFVIPAAILGELDHRIEFDDQLSAIRAAGDPYVAARTYYLRKRQAEIDALRGRGSSTVQATPAPASSGPAPK
jgi:phospholipid-binding lipoprotein MlaA